MDKLRQRRAGTIKRVVNHLSAPHPPKEHGDARVRRLGRYAAHGFIASVVFVATMWTARLLISTTATADITEAVSTIVLLLALGVVFLAGGLAHEILFWRLPTMRLKTLLSEIRAGDRTPDDLEQINYGMTPLVPQIKLLYDDIASAKKEIADLNVEMRQRIANRTDALERQLGTMRAKASRDALTRLSNRRSFDEAYPTVLETCRAARRNLVLMMIDVDHFKNLNDTLGHQAGDDFLRSIGQILRSTLRENDHAFRYGGDEFVLLLPDADMISARALSDRLRHLIDGLTKHQRQLNPRPQLSIGIASLIEDVTRQMTDDQLLTIADQRLYAIKHARSTEPGRKTA